MNVIETDKKSFSDRSHGGTINVFFYMLLETYLYNIKISIRSRNLGQILDL